MALEEAEPASVRASPRARARANDEAAREAERRPGRIAPEDVTTLYERLSAERPAPTTELSSINPYTLLVAVVLSAQATDVGVNRATTPLFRVVQTPAEMVAYGEEALREAVKSLGFYRAKAANVIRLSEILVAEHGGQVPRDVEALRALPGVGRKTASVVLNTAFGEPLIAVDTHIFRLSNRTGLGPGRTPDLVQDELERVTPDRFKRYAHHWLLLHGRYVCRAPKPDCPRCSIADLCLFEGKTDERTAPGPRAAAG